MSVHKKNTQNSQQRLRNSTAKPSQISAITSGLRDQTPLNSRPRTTVSRVYTTVGTWDKTEGGSVVVSRDKDRWGGPHDTCNADTLSKLWGGSLHPNRVQRKPKQDFNAFTSGAPSRGIGRCAMLELAKLLYLQLKHDDTAQEPKLMVDHA